MIVTDASVLTLALVDHGVSGERVRAELARDQAWAAPPHVLVEVLSSVRGLVLGGKLAPSEAEQALQDLGEMVIDLVAITPVFPRMWELASNLTAYDAAYVAVAEARGCALLTLDARLARAPGPRCEIRLVAPEHRSQGRACCDVAASPSSLNDNRWRGGSGN